MTRCRTRWRRLRGGGGGSNGGSTRSRARARWHCSCGTRAFRVCKRRFVRSRWSTCRWCRLTAATTSRFRSTFGSSSRMRPVAPCGSAGSGFDGLCASGFRRRTTAAPTGCGGGCASKGSRGAALCRFVFRRGNGGRRFGTRFWRRSSSRCGWLCRWGRRRFRSGSATR